jgi:hypothetical protein
MLFGRALALGVELPCGLSKPIMLDRTESARCKPEGELTLHRLTLSERFIMALCTNPPMPLVGESGGLVGDVRPGDGGMDWRLTENASTSPAESPNGGSRRGAPFRGRGEPSLPGSVGVTGREIGFSFDGSIAESRDMPGSCVRIEDMSAVSWSSTWLFLNAPDPRPGSAVWRNQEGSFPARD